MGLRNLRRSRSAANISGRVAVAHVQGSPKGGGALARAQVTNTRLPAGLPLGYEEAALAVKRDRNYGKMIAQGALARADDQSDEGQSVAAKYLQSLIGPIAIRDRSRRFLMYGLEGALGNLPPEIAVRYLEEMADDTRELGYADAVRRFIDKALPKISENNPTRQSDSP